MPNSNKIRSLPFILLVTANLLVACNSTPTASATPAHNPQFYTPTSTRVRPTDTPSQPTATNTSPATATITPTQTRTPKPSPTHTAQPTETATPTLTPKAQDVSLGNAIVIYFIIPGTGGPVACGDSLMPVYSGLIRTGDIKRDVPVAFNRLFSYGVKNVGNLYNALYQSRLKFSQLDYNMEKRDLTLYSIGKYVKPETDCDALRYRAQVWATIRQFPEVKTLHVWANNQRLGDLLAVLDK